VLLEQGLKDSTKDIDVVCRNENDKEILLFSARRLGFELVGPEKRHARLGVNRLAVKGMRNLDVFAGRISYDFELSEPMWQRAIVSRTFGDLVVRDASREDIFVMTYIEEGIGRQEEEFSMKVPIADKISQLANEYRERLYQKWLFAELYG
jgi:hypothetical protein